MKKKSSRSSIERKSTSISAGINFSTKNQLKKIENTKIKKELDQVPLSNFYMRVNGKWIHKGICCRLCNILMNNTTVIEKHRYVCEVLNKKSEDY